MAASVIDAKIIVMICGMAFIYCFINCSIQLGRLILETIHGRKSQRSTILALVQESVGNSPAHPMELTCLSLAGFVFGTGSPLRIGEI